LHNNGFADRGRFAALRSLFGALAFGPALLRGQMERAREGMRLKLLGDPSGYTRHWNETREERATRRRKANQAAHRRNVAKRKLLARIAKEERFQRAMILQAGGRFVPTRLDPSWTPAQ
jgi:hypothetical protein